MKSQDGGLAKGENVGKMSHKSIFFMVRLWRRCDLTLGRTFFISTEMNETIGCKSGDIY